MILAAGRGERLRPLTDSTPKPLLAVRGKPLIVHHLEALARASVSDVVVNVSWLSDQIRDALGNGSDYGLNIHYSDEGEEALETGGGVFKALPFLGTDPFIVVNGDVFTDFDYATLPAEPNGLAHLILVSNPEHNADGDFGLDDGKIVNSKTASWTFSGIAVYRPELFADCHAGKFPLAPLLRAAADTGHATGSVHEGYWRDVGTIERLTLIRTG